ncbi:MAG: fimbrillin family protein [Prevotella sp.]
MKTTKILFLSMMAVAIAACSNDEDVASDTAVAAKVSGEIAGAYATRTTSLGWETNDAIGVSVASTGKTTGTNVKYTFNGSIFEALAPIYFSDMETVTFNAYYPYTADNVVTKTITAADEAAPASIDFLFASGATASILTPEVSFTGNHSFKHCMSQLTLTFKKGNDITDLSKLTNFTVGGLVMEGSFTPSTGVAAASATASASNLTVNIDVNTSGDSYTAAPLILFPQSTADGKFTVSLVYDGIPYRATLTLPASLALSAGYNVCYNITINKSGLSVSNGEIKPWTVIDSGDFYPSYYNPRGIVRADQEVDLGLTIQQNGKIYKVIFAKSNLTATGLAANESDCGDFFAWAATEPWYNSYYTDRCFIFVDSWKTGKSEGYSIRYTPYYDVSNETFTKYLSNGEELEMADDAARMILGGDWQIPTAEIMQALIDVNNFVVQWGEGGNMETELLSPSPMEERKRMKITCMADNSKYIYLPAYGFYEYMSNRNEPIDPCGHYWTRKLETSKNGTALVFSSGYVHMESNGRDYGLLIRPVRLVETPSFGFKPVAPAEVGDAAVAKK